MDVTVAKQDIVRALYLTQNIVAKKNPNPVMGNLLLSAREGKLIIAATGSDMSMVVNVTAEIRTVGSIMLNAKILGEIVRELPEGALTLTLGEADRVEIVSGRSKLRLVGSNAEQFPTIMGFGLTPRNQIDGTTLVDMIDKTIYAVSQDETRYNLNGVCFDPIEADGKSKRSSLRLVATDGHRLSMITRPVPNLTFTDRVIAPRRGLPELKKLMEGQEGRVLGIDVQNQILLFQAGDAQLSMGIIDGEFPDYTSVLPSGKSVVTTISSDELGQALRRVALMVTDKDKCVRFDFSPGRLRLSGSSPEIGDATEELEIAYEGEVQTIGYNSQYILDFINSIREPQPINLRIYENGGPGSLSPVSDESYISVVMPMRI